MGKWAGRGAVHLPTDSTTTTTFGNTNYDATIPYSVTLNIDATREGVSSNAGVGCKVWPSLTTGSPTSATRCASLVVATRVA